METINTRIVNLIESLHIKRSEFSERIQVSQAFISQICSGVRQPSGRTISDICRIFGVRREWLEDGIGPMYPPESDILVMNNRIKQIRSESKLSMRAFAERIGISSGAVAHLEDGKNNPSERTVRAICSEFNIRRQWLEDGIGPMHPTEFEDKHICPVVRFISNTPGIRLMKDRIKELRKSYKLTQFEFANRLGLKQNSIAQIELGNRNPSPQTINSICREFGVRRQWLENGTGPMYSPKTVDDEIINSVLEYIKPIIRGAANTSGGWEMMYELFTAIQAELDKANDSNDQK